MCQSGAYKMTIEVGKGGGIFRAESFIHNENIASGQTGNLITIGTAGKVTIITYLAATSNQPGVGVTVDGDDVSLVGGLGGETSGVGWRVTSYGGQTSISRWYLAYITGEFITITKDAGNTTQDITLSYVTGEVK